jgi:hypothetical protein
MFRPLQLKKKLVKNMGLETMLRLGHVTAGPRYGWAALRLGRVTAGPRYGWAVLRLGRVTAGQWYG